MRPDVPFEPSSRLTRQKAAWRLARPRSFVQEAGDALALELGAAFRTLGGRLAVVARLRGLVVRSNRREMSLMVGLLEAAGGAGAAHGCDGTPAKGRQ